MNIGLVLAGGFAKGAYQVGALQAINEFIPPESIKCASCSSVGALNGFAYATQNLGRAEEMWRNICNSDKRVIVSKIMRSDLLQQDIRELGETDRALPFPFYCSFTNLNHMNIVYKNLTKIEAEQLPLYLKASIAMPVLNPAVKIEGNTYYDGGIVDNIPVFPLMKYDLDYIICMYFDDACYKFENTSFDNKMIKITFPSEGIVGKSLTIGQRDIDEMIQTGYERAKYILKSVFVEGYDNLDYIYNAIKYMNRGSNSSLRVTTDVLITNINKVTSKLTKKKIL